MRILAAQFHYHVLDVPGPDMVHVTKSHLPEIVLFGRDQQFQLPLMLDAGKDHPRKRSEGRQDNGKPLCARCGTETAGRISKSRRRDSARSSRSGGHIRTWSKRFNKPKPTARCRAASRSMPCRSRDADTTARPTTCSPMRNKSDDDANSGRSDRSGHTVTRICSPGRSEPILDFGFRIAD